MNDEQALEIVRRLADGVDPASGEELPPASVMQRPHAVRAMLSAATALELKIERTRRRSTLPDHAGRPWSRQEDDNLVTGFHQNKTVEELARQHRRTLRAIQLRLLKLGKV